MTLAKTFKARYRNGVIEPLESLSLEEGKEIAVTVIELPAKRNIHAGRRVVQLRGLWKDVSFDISNEDIRQVRRKLSRSLQRRVKTVW